MPLEKNYSSLARSAGCLCAPLLRLSLLFVLVASAPASAELAISQLVVELKPGALRAADVEIFNDSAERSFVSVEPREIIAPGTVNEQRFVSSDPEKLGLLVSPTRLILEPHQRRTLRLAAIGPQEDRERVYRVTVKPVTGEVTGSQSGLKLLVGYDLLVLARPSVAKPDIKVVRAGRNLTITNHGNTSVEIANGKQCDEKGSDCRGLASKRLYAGAQWYQTLPQATPGEYHLRSADSWSTLKF